MKLFFEYSDSQYRSSRGGIHVLSAKLNGTMIGMGVAKMTGFCVNSELPACVVTRELDRGAFYCPFAILPSQ